MREKQPDDQNTSRQAGTQTEKHTDDDLESFELYLLANLVNLVTQMHRLTDRRTNRDGRTDNRQTTDGQTNRLTD